MAPPALCAWLRAEAVRTCLGARPPLLPAFLCIGQRREAKHVAARQKGDRGPLGADGGSSYLAGRSGPSQRATTVAVGQRHLRPRVGQTGSGTERLEWLLGCLRRVSLPGGAETQRDGGAATLCRRLSSADWWGEFPELPGRDGAITARLKAESRRWAWRCESLLAAGRRLSLPASERRRRRACERLELLLSV